MNHLKALLDVILDSVLAQADHIIRIAVERDNLPGLARELSGAQCEITQMSTDVVDNGARMKGCPKVRAPLRNRARPANSGLRPEA